MRSWAAYARFTPESMMTAVKEARLAVSLAPDYAIARGTLAMGLAIFYQQTGFRNRKVIEEAISHAEAALELNPNHASVLFEVVYAFTNAGRWDGALALAEHAVELNPSLIDARHALAFCLTHFERYEEALEHLAEGDRAAPRSFQNVLSLGHRSWALYGLGHLEEALDVVTEYVRLAPLGLYQMLTRTIILQELGRTDEAQGMMRKTRKVLPTEPLEFWIGLIRGSYLPESLFASFSRHFTEVWNATPEDPGA
jgi:tetratricopeptide (TPR) repeat protein